MLKTRIILKFIMIIITLALSTETAFAARGCVDRGIKTYETSLRKPFLAIDRPDSSGLEACAKAIETLSSLSVSISFIAINLGAIVNAIIQQAMSAVCEYLNGQVTSNLSAVSDAFNQGNTLMTDLLQQRDTYLGSSNAASLVNINQISQQFGPDPTIQLNHR